MIDFAGGPYQFSGLSAGQHSVARQRFGCLCDKIPLSGSRVTHVRIFHAEGNDFRPIQLRGWEYHLDLDPGPVSVRIAGLDFMARLDWSPCLSGALWTSMAGGYEFAGVFENFFRVLVAYQLLERGGVLLHSAAVVDHDDAALLFFGHSGAGKSTISRLALASGRRVLSDDLNAVTIEGGMIHVHQVPFSGDIGQTVKPSLAWRLRSALRLRKGNTLAVKSLGAATAVASLIACAPSVNRDRYRADRLIANLDSIARSAQVAELTFSTDTPFDAIMSVLRGKT